MSRSEFHNYLDSEIASRLRDIDTDDVERAHLEAAELLSELLERAGYERALEAYQEIPKWYA